VVNEFVGPVELGEDEIWIKKIEEVGK